MIPTWYKIYLVAVWAMYLGISLGCHGKERTPHNFFIALLATAVSIFITFKAGILP